MGSVPVVLFKLLFSCWFLHKKNNGEERQSPAMHGDDATAREVRLSLHQVRNQGRVARVTLTLTRVLTVAAPPLVDHPIGQRPPLGRLDHGAT
jgi:hypothetical protein